MSGKMQNKRKQLQTELRAVNKSGDVRLVAEYVGELLELSKAALIDEPTGLNAGKAQAYRDLYADLTKELAQNQSDAIKYSEGE